MNSTLEKTSDAYEATSANEASQLVRAGWVLNTIKKHHDLGGKPYLVYYMSCPPWYKPSPQSVVQNFRHSDHHSAEFADHTPRGGRMSFLAEWFHGQMNRAATAE